MGDVAVCRHGVDSTHPPTYLPRYKKSFYGTCSYLPAAFGLHAAAYVVTELLGGPSLLADTSTMPVAYMGDVRGRARQRKAAKDRRRAEAAVAAAGGGRVATVMRRQSEGVSSALQQSADAKTVTGPESTSSRLQTVDVQPDEAVPLTTGGTRLIGGDAAACSGSSSAELLQRRVSSIHGVGTGYYAGEGI